MSTIEYFGSAMATASLIAMGSLYLVDFIKNGKLKYYSYGLLAAITACTFLVGKVYGFTSFVFFVSLLLNLLLAWRMMQPLKLKVWGIRPYSIPMILWEVAIGVFVGLSAAAIR